MGLLDGILGQITASVGNQSGQQVGLVQSVIGMLTSGQGGGLPGLIQKMEQQGLGSVAASWVGTGPNHAITPAQIQQILGNAQVQQFAQQHGIDVNQVCSHLAQIVPVAVDKLTPAGTVPNTTGPGGLGDLLKGFLPS